MTPRDLRNTTINIVGESIWMFQASMIAPTTVLAVLLHSLGAGETMVGSISSVEGGLMVAPQIIGNYLFHSRRHRKRHMMLWHFLAMIPCLLGLAAMANPAMGLSPEFRRWGLLTCFAMFMFTMGVVTPAWLDWIAHIFGVGRRGTVMGLTWCVAAASSVAGPQIAGWAINTWPGMGTYSWLYFCASLIAYASITLFCFMDDHQAKDAGPTSPPQLGELIVKFRQSLADRNFRAFLVGRLLAMAGFCMLPLVVLHYTSAEGGSMSEGDVIRFSGTAGAIGMAAAGLLLGRVGDKHGHRIGVLAGAGFQVAVLAVLLTTRGSWSCMAAYFLTGACVASAAVSYANMIFETCPHENRMAHITVANTIVSAAAIGAPLAAGMTASAVGIRPLFAICLAFSVLALAWFILRVKEPRDTKLA